MTSGKSSNFKRFTKSKSKKCLVRTFCALYNSLDQKIYFSLVLYFLLRLCQDIERNERIIIMIRKCSYFLKKMVSEIIRTVELSSFSGKIIGAPKVINLTFIYCYPFIFRSINFIVAIVFALNLSS